jgi:hypothetical protein
MKNTNRRAQPDGFAGRADALGTNGQDLIALAQRLARDAERHALLSASLASQADRLMMAGIRQLERRGGTAAGPHSAH